MSIFQPTFQLTREPGESTYRALARHLITEIRRGRLAAGSKLPGTRSLAQQLGVSRNTVLCAYDEVTAQGWLEAREASGTFVVESVPDTDQTSRSVLEVTGRTQGFDMPRVHGLPGLSTLEPVRRGALAGGLPDFRLIPVDLLARAYRRVLRHRGHTLLGYGDPRGELGLRQELAKMYSATRGLALTTDNLLITRGAQMALSLAARLLIRPGDRVAVERFGYQPVWDMLRLAGAQLVPIPVDQSGMQVERLEQIDNLRAVYTTPHHQYPTTALLSPSRRAWLLRWAEQRRCAILEDDYDHEFQYRGQPVLPLKSQDPAGVVIYIGGLSKVLAPGLRIGCLVGARQWIEQAALLRRTWDHQGDQPTEAAVAELLSTGEIQRHVSRMRKVYAGRRQALLDALDKELPGCFQIHVPAGGMALWARILDGTDPEAWSAEASKHGLEVRAGRSFDLRNRPAPYLRIGFAANDEGEIWAAVRKLRQAHAVVRKSAGF